jgi:lysophospholipase L1-like esterase
MGSRRGWLALAVALGLLVIIAAFGPRAWDNLRNATRGEATVDLGDGWFEATVPARPHRVPLTGEHEILEMGNTTTFRYRRNTLGFRGAETQLRQTPGRYRVTALGASEVFGVGVGEDETFMALLGARLAGSASGPPPEALTIGVPGATAGDLLDKLERDWAALGTDVLLICPGSGTLESKAHAGFEPTRARLAEDEYERLEDNYRHATGRMIDDARSRGAQVVLMTPPVTSLFPLPDVERFLAIAREVAAHKGCPLLDAARLFQDIERREGLTLEQEGGLQRLVQHRAGEATVLLETRYADPGNVQPISPEIYAYLDREKGTAQALSLDGNHPNARGHQLLADALFELLGDEGWLPPARIGGAPPGVDP